MRVFIQDGACVAIQCKGSDTVAFLKYAIQKELGMAQACGSPRSPLSCLSLRRCALFHAKRTEPSADVSACRGRCLRSVPHSCCQADDQHESPLNVRRRAKQHHISQQENERWRQRLGFGCQAQNPEGQMVRLLEGQCPAPPDAIPNTTSHHFFECCTHVICCKSVTAD